MCMTKTHHSAGGGGSDRHTSLTRPTPVFCTCRVSAVTLSSPLSVLLMPPCTPMMSPMSRFAFKPLCGQGFVSQITRSSKKTLYAAGMGVWSSRDEAT